MAATIKDIARALNISTSTVSYALNGGPRKVPASVRDRVLRTAQELNYRPNRVAKSLVMRRSFTLGVLPTEATENLAVVPYFEQCFNGIINEAEVKEYDVLVYSRFSQGADTEQVLASLLDGRADGIVLIAPLVDTPVLRELQFRNIPHSVVNSMVEGSVCYSCDNSSGVRLAVEHLYSLGHRKIGHLAGRQSLQDGIERKEAFIQVMRDFELEVRPEWILDTDFSPNIGRMRAKEIFAMDDLPTALFCANDEIAVGVYQAAWELDISIPENMSVVGFDNSSLSTVMLPALTTVRQPVSAMGSEAVRGLLAQIEGQPIASRRFETELVVRSSTSPPKNS